MINEAEKLMKGSVHEDNFFIVYNTLVLMTSKETINRMKQNGSLQVCLLPFNGMQYGNRYVGRTVSYSPDVIPLDNLLNHEIIHSLRIDSVLSCFILDGEAIGEEESTMRFSYSIPREIYQGLNCIWYSQM